MFYNFGNIILFNVKLIERNNMHGLKKHSEENTVSRVFDNSIFVHKY